MQIVVSSLTPVNYYSYKMQLAAVRFSQSLLMKQSSAMLYHCVALLAVLLVRSSAAPTSEVDSFLRGPDNIDECYKPHTFTIFYTDYSEGPNGEIVEKNASRLRQTYKCCEGYELVGPRCVKNISSAANPCGGNVTCINVPDAQCTVYKKCGKEIALFMKDGSIVTECHNGGSMDPLSCSGVCVQDPCEYAECPAFGRDEVLCFVTGCDCQATWIHLKDKAEVNCQTGEVVNKQEPDRSKREACQ